MIVLDINVVSEIMSPRPQPAVLAWLDAQPAAELWLARVAAAELLYGVARLPDGTRKQQLARAIHSALEEDSSGRVLPFDLASASASVYADLCAQRSRAGLPIAMSDAQIAALATRNRSQFDGLGLVMIDPWAGQ